MVQENMEEDVISIDVIDPIGDNDVAVIPEEGITESGDYPPIKVSNLEVIGTGNIISHIFNLINQTKENNIWKLEDKEIKELNNTCPKILPEVLRKHAGLIGCILSLGGMVVKRIKLEKQQTVESTTPQISDKIEPKGLTGGRTS